MLTGNEIRRLRSLCAGYEPNTDIDGTWLDISPFNDSQVNPNSYNLRLGRTLLVYPVNIANVLNTTFGLGQQIANRQMDEILKTATAKPGTPMSDWSMDTAVENEPVRFDIPEEGVVLIPGVLYLGHTVEETHCRNLIPVIEGRSSVARCGIQIHSTAGFGDNGFRGQWTLEITCVFPVRVYAGTEICQISFHPAEGVPGPYYDGKYRAQRGPVASGWWKDVGKLRGGK